MRRAVVVLVGLIFVAGLSIIGCGSKKKTTGGVEADVEAGGGASAAPVEWHYDVAPNPVFEGAPDYLLTSFGFDYDSAVMKTEGMGACREAVKKLKDIPGAKLVAVGFADGIKELNDAEGLGLKRAEAANRFMDTLGIAQEQMQITSFGSRYSIAKDFETIKQVQERKVEIWVLR